MRKLVYILLGFALLSVVVSSCASYDKLLKSDDINLKYEKAKEYYNNGNYAKALPLLNQLVNLYRGTEMEEELRYYIAYCHYGQSEFLISAALFKNYYSIFPRSDKASECLFMAADSYYNASPKHSLDQTMSSKAIESYQLFINTYPADERVSEANSKIDNLRRKLEIKDFESADLYYKMRDYKAAAVAYENLLINYPDIPNAERVKFLIIKSYVQLADRSVTCKKEERYEKAIKAYNSFIDRYPASNYSKDADNLYNKSLEKKKEGIIACENLNRTRDFTKAENYYRTKRYEKAINAYEDFLIKYPDKADFATVELSIIRSYYEWGKESEICEQAEPLETALQLYYQYIEKHKESVLLKEAEDLYGEILNLLDKSKKDCDELSEKT